VNNKDLTIEQICMHLGECAMDHKGAVVTPIYQTSSYHLDSDYEYSRGPAPNFEVVEKKVAALDGGEGAVMVGSGVAAAASIFMATLKAGDHVIMVQSAYVNSRKCLMHLENFGVSYTLVHGKDIAEFEQAIRPNTKLIFIESPTSFVCELQDIPAVCELAHSKGILVAIDNTCAGIFQKPMDMGVDIVMYSASKYLGGHADIIGGIVVANGEILAKLRELRIIFGWVSTPFNAWLVQRGMRTLKMRMLKVQENSFAVAKLLNEHPCIEKLYHPAADDYDQKDLFKKQMTGFGGMFSFKAKDAKEEDYENFVHRCQVFQHAVSWGGHESLVYSIGAGGSIADDLLRRSVHGGILRVYTGLEDTNDLLNDMEYALEAFKK